ncbi:MAG: hypothetical protein R3288_10155, partial [Woeseiaceae bacterium]|nr:hypothetical protein [Woeseiaceae bacterium]
DLLAETLARSLSCDLLRQTAGEYRIGPSIADDEGALDGTLDLVRNNLITHASLALTADAGQSNATLIGEAHPIDGALHQYWLTVVPRVADGELRSLSASAYVVLPNAGLASVGPEPQPLPAPSAAVPASLSIPNAGNAAMLGPLRVSVPESTDDCGALQPSMTPASRWHVQHDCSVLEAESLQDAIVFVLQHQPQLGLVRLGGAACRHRTTARVVRRGERLRFPIAWLRPQGGNVRPAADWLKSPQRDTYYAIALSDSRTARRLANHIDALPLRCSTSLKPGLTGLRLQHWFDEFAALAASSASHLDWRGVELKDVY